MTEQYVTYQEAATMLERTYNTVRNLVATGRLHAVKIKGQKYKMLDRAEVERYQRGERTTPEASQAPEASQVQALIARAQENIPPLLLGLLGAAASFYLSLKVKAAEQDKAIIEGYNASLEKIAALGQPTQAPAPEWFQQFMGNPNPSREETLEIAKHIPDATSFLFPGVDKVPPEQRPFIEEALSEGLGAIWDKMNRQKQEALAREREKIPA